MFCIRDLPCVTFSLTECIRECNVISHLSRQPPSWSTPWLSGRYPDWSHPAGRSSNKAPPPSSGHRPPFLWDSRPARGNLCDRASYTAGFQTQSRSRSQRRTYPWCPRSLGCLCTATRESIEPQGCRWCTTKHFPWKKKQGGEVFRPEEGRDLSYTK